MTDLLVDKIIFLIVVFFATLLASCLPWILRTAVKIQNFLVVMTVGMAFSGGIILGGGLSHLLPDATEAFEDYFNATTNPGITHTDYPFSSLITAATLIILIVVDQIVNATVLVHSEEGHGGHGHNHMVVDVPKDGEASTHADSSDIERQDSSSASASTASNRGKAAAKTSAAANDDEEVVSAEERRKRIAQAWIFFIALSVHSVFDGLGVGAESDPDGYYGLLVAVASHKLMDGFALGVPVYFGKLPRWQTIGSLVFCALMTPLGIGIGIGATQQVDGTQGLLARGIILSISAGSFLFISLIELLPSALHKHGWTKLKLVLFGLGWGIMALIALWV